MMSLITYLILLNLRKKNSDIGNNTFVRMLECSVNMHESFGFMIRKVKKGKI